MSAAPFSSAPFEALAQGLWRANDFDWSPTGELLDSWSETATAGLLAFIARLDFGSLSQEEIESRLDWWWRGEDRNLRRAMERVHSRQCERGRGFLFDRATGKKFNARCKSWRECSYCAWVYGCSVQRLWEQVRGLRALVVFTMPPEQGDWSNKEHLAAQARAMRRLAERLNRKFGHRFAMLWAREHNTHGDGAGRLHLNLLWDEYWVDQAWLSETAAACGFGEVVHISRVGKNGQASGSDGRPASATPYALKSLRYASKDIGSQTDWPKFTRRWGASRAARVQMKRPDKNPDWYWSPIDPPRVPVGFDSGAIRAAWAERAKTDEASYWLLPERYLPSRAALAEGQPRAGPPRSREPVQSEFPFCTLVPLPF
jgi:hypothetical protein